MPPLLRCGSFVNWNPKCPQPVIFGIVGDSANGDMSAEDIVLHLFALSYKVAHIGFPLSRLEVALLTHGTGYDTLFSQSIY